MCLINGQFTWRHEIGGLTSFTDLEVVGRLTQWLDIRVTPRDEVRILKT